MDQEQRFSRVLEATTRFRQAGEMLWLFNDQGQELARLVRIQPRP